MKSHISINSYEYTKIENKISFQKVIFCLIGFLSFIITIDSTAISGYEYQFLIPLSYTFVYLFFAPPINKLGFGYLTLNLIWLIRYCIGPVIHKLTDYQIRFYSNVSSEDLFVGLILMIIELWVTIIACGIFLNKRKTGKIASYSRLMNNNESKISTIIVLAILLLSGLVIIFDPNAIKSFNFILNQEYIQSTGTKFGISVLILIWCKYVVTVFLIGKLSAKNNHVPNSVYLVSSVTIMLISISFFTGVSRSSILIEAIAYVALLIYYFPRKKKEIMIICFTTLFIILLTITLYRFYDTQSLSVSSEFFELNSLSFTINSYFAGQQNIAVGVKSLRLFWEQYDLFTLSKDLLANTVMLNTLVTNITGTVEIYNLTLYGHNNWADQISPTITQALGLFNIFGLFIPILIMYFIIKMDTIANTNKYAFGIFLSTLIAVNLAFYSTGNITILSTAITNTFIPLFIIYKLTKHKFRL